MHVEHIHLRRAMQSGSIFRFIFSLLFGFALYSSIK